MRLLIELSSSDNDSITILSYYSHSVQSVIYVVLDMDELILQP